MLLGNTKFAIGMVAFATMFLSACNPDCREVTIEKAEWTTRYEDYYVEKDTVEEIKEYVDTLVSYSITEHRTKTDLKKDADGKVTSSKCTHYVTIRNNNESYSNRFAVRAKGEWYDEAAQKWKNYDKTTGYVFIHPQESHTFAFNHSSWWRNDQSGSNENNVRIYIRQDPENVCKEYRRPVKVKQKKTRRIDNLV